MNETEQSLEFQKKRENHQDRSQTANESANYQNYKSQKEEVQIKFKVSQEWEHSQLKVQQQR